jgi:hypothetical protein
MLIVLIQFQEDKHAEARLQCEEYHHPLVISKSRLDQ